MSVPYKEIHFEFDMIDFQVEGRTSHHLAKGTPRNIDLRRRDGQDRCEGGS